MSHLHKKEKIVVGIIIGGVSLLVGILIFLQVVSSRTIVTPEQITTPIKNDITCPMDVKKCSDRSTVGRVGPDCAFEKCPEEDGVEEKDCPGVYAPVCAQPPMPQCPPGLGCVQVMPEQRTFLSACEAHNEGADVLYEGECSDEEVDY